MISIPANIVHKKVGEETVLLNFDLGVYYGLDPLGSQVWERLSAGATIEVIVAEIVRDYDVSPEMARDDVLELVEELSSRGLITR